MTPRTWNLSILLALVVSVATIGSGVFLWFGLGPALTAFGASILAWGVLIGATITRGGNVHN